MTIHGWWWPVLLGGIGLVFAAIVSLRADKGGRNIVDFGDPFMGCFIPVFIVLAGLLLGVTLTASHAVLRIAF